MKKYMKNKNKMILQNDVIIERLADNKVNFELPEGVIHVSSAAAV